MSYIKQRQIRGQMGLDCSTPLVVDIISANTYQLVEGTWCDGSNNLFTISGNTLKYTGIEDVVVFFAGHSDLQVSKVGQLSYGLYKNGQLVSGAETPHTFVTSAKTSTISIAKIIELSYNDELEIWVKYDDDSAELTIYSLTILCWANKNK